MSFSEKHRARFLDSQTLDGRLGILSAIVRVLLMRGQLDCCNGTAIVL